MKKNTIGSIYLAIAASIWGGMYVISKVVLAVIPPLELVWIRYLIALVTLVSIGLITRQSWKVNKRDIPMMLAIGIIGYAISIWCQFLGTQWSSAQMGATITSATPVFMVLFARILLKEKLTLRKALSVILATCGVLMIVGIGHGEGKSQLGGVVLGIAALTWGLMSVLVKKVPGRYSQLVVTTYAILVATVVITPFVLTSVQSIPMDLFLQPSIWGAILYLGVLSTAGAFFLWNKGLQMVDASKGGLFLFFQPVVGTWLGWLLLGESIGFAFWIGAILISSGVLLVLKKETFANLIHQKGLGPRGSYRVLV